MHIYDYLFWHKSKNSSARQVQLQNLATFILVSLQATFIFGKFLWWSKKPCKKICPYLDSALKLFASIYGGILAGQNDDNMVKIRAEVESAQKKIGKVVISVGAALR